MEHKRWDSKASWMLALGVAHGMEMGCATGTYLLGGCPVPSLSLFSLHTAGPSRTGHLHRPLLEHCENTHMTIWLGMYAYKGESFSHGRCRATGIVGEMFLWQTPSLGVSVNTEVNEPQD